MDFKGRVNLDLNSEWVAQRVRDEAHRVAARARAYAPVDSGELRSSITVHVERNSGVKRDRAVGVVTAGTDHSLAAEFGTSKSRGHFFLRRAVNG